MHLAAARERRLLAVEREPAAGDRVVLERAPHQARRSTTGRPSSENAGGAGVGELAHLGQLLALAGPSVIAAEEADRHLGLARARASISEPSTAAESTTGSVFGIARIAQ